MKEVGNKSYIAALVITLIAASILINLQTATAFSPDTWTPKSAMFTARIGCAAAVANGKIFVIGGYGGDVVNANEQYNPATDEWAQKAPMPTPRTDLAVASVNGIVYAIGGYQEDVGGVRYTNYGINEAYNPEADSWLNMSSMPTPRVGLSANVANGKIFLIGGAVVKDTLYGTRFEIKAANEVYDPATNSWTTASPIPTPVYYYASAVLDEKIYIIGGNDENGGTNLNQIYDPAKDTWASGTPTPSGTNLDAAAATTGVLAPKRIYVFGNQGDADPRSNQNWGYDPATRAWTSATPMPTGRAALTAATVNDTIYAIGGFGSQGTIYKTCEQYIPIGYAEGLESPSQSPLSSPTPSAKPPAANNSQSPSPAPSTKPTIPTVPPLNDYTPTLSSSPIPSPTQEPTSTPNTQPENFTPTIIIIALVVAVAVLAILAYSVKHGG